MGRKLRKQRSHQKLKKIHDIDTYTLIDAKILTREDQSKALLALSFLNEKQDDRIKGQKCAVGSK